MKLADSLPNSTLERSVDRRPLHSGQKSHGPAVNTFLTESTENTSTIESTENTSTIEGSIESPLSPSISPDYAGIVSTGGGIFVGVWDISPVTKTALALPIRKLTAQNVSRRIAESNAENWGRTMQKPNRGRLLRWLHGFENHWRFEILAWGFALALVLLVLIGAVLLRMLLQGARP